MGGGRWEVRGEIGEGEAGEKVRDDDRDKYMEYMKGVRLFNVLIWDFGSGVCLFRTILRRIRMKPSVSNTLVSHYNGHDSQNLRPSSHTGGSLRTHLPRQHPQKIIMTDRWHVGIGQIRPT